MDLHALHLNYTRWLGRYNVLFPLHRYVFPNKINVQTRLRIVRPGRTHLRWACPKQTHARWVCPRQTHLISFRSKQLVLDGERGHGTRLRLLGQCNPARAAALSCPPAQTLCLTLSTCARPRTPATSQRSLFDRDYGGNERNQSFVSKNT